MIRNLPKPEKQEPSIVHDNPSNQFDFDAILKQLDALRRSMDDKFSHVYKLLDLKADKADLDLLERRLTDFIRSFLDRFADKKDVTKKLAQMDSKINALLEMILSQQNKDNEDDAMFTKKPLGGVSCASCEKNIVNLEGLQADFLPWRRLPFKENNERIAKFGPGFSKILQSLRPASITVTNSELD